MDLQTDGLRNIHLEPICLERLFERKKAKKELMPT